MPQEERGPDGPDKNRRIARTVISELDQAQQEVLAEYVGQLVLVRHADRPAQTKTLDAIDLTADKDVLGVLTKGSGRLLAKHAWTDRSWPGRIGIGAAALATVLTAGQGAGIALLGTAIGVPLWIVFGSGGEFAGVLLDEIDQSRGPLDTDHQLSAEAADAGESERRRIDEALGIDPETFDAVKERLEELKEDIRAGKNPGDLLQKWLSRRK